MADERNGNLESLIEESLRQRPVFSSEPKEGPASDLRHRLISKWPAISAAAATAALSAIGNPIYTPPAVGAITYFITDLSYKLFKKNQRVKEEDVGPDTASSMYNRLFQFKLPFSIVSGAMALAASISYKLYQLQVDLPQDIPGYYSGLLPLLPHLTPEITFSFINGMGAYTLLNGLEKILHSQSLAAMKHTALRKFHRMRSNRQKEAENLECLAAIPHSKEKEVEALLQLEDAYLEAGQPSKAIDANKRLLKAATRTDEFIGVSDWLIKQAKERPYTGEHSNLRNAMHEFAAGDLNSAYSHLVEAVSSDPKNRQLRRVLALFFEATGNSSAASLEMRIYEELLRQEPQLTFRMLGESRNEVLVPVDETAPFPDVYIKRSRNKASLDEEVANINAFSGELPGMLPKVVRQDFDGEYHYIVLESMGNATMLQKALTGNLSQSDVKAVLDLLVKVVVAGEKLTKEGKIKANEPMIAGNYTYSNADAMIAEGESTVQPNILEDRIYYFAHRVTDVFALMVQQHNGVPLSEGFEDVLTGALALSSMVLDPAKYFNVTYTDFTPRNIMFDSESGNLRGKVDWEQVKILPFLFEVVNVLEFYGMKLASVEYGDMFKYLIKKLERELHINGQVVMGQYHAAAALRHLELTGYMSRDSATNPTYVKAQVHNYFVARFHLFEAKRHASGEAKEVLDRMYNYLEKQQILKDEKEQSKLELEIRHSVVPSTAYIWHELTTKKYWQDAWQSFPKVASPKELLAMLSQKGLKGIWHGFRHQEKTAYKRSDPDIALLGQMFGGVPAMFTAIAAYDILSYAVMQAIMPSL